MYFFTIWQGSKLNPGAKVFTPSAANFRQVLAPVPRLINPSQMSNSLAMVPTVGSQLGNEMNSLASHFTVPSKVVPYNNQIAAQPGNRTNHTRPVCSLNALCSLNMYDAFFMNSRSL